MRYASIALCTAAMTFAIAALARAPYTPPGSSDARLRFSWRMSVSSHETCRPRTQAELDRLPVHMRTPEVCTREDARYALVLQIDDAQADTIQLVRGGVKEDRPLFVLEDRVLPPGSHRVRIRLVRSTASRRKVLASLDRNLKLSRGEIQLITLDADADRLIVRSADPSTPSRGGGRGRTAPPERHRRR